MTDADELHKAAETLRKRARAATDEGHGWRVADLAGGNEVWADRDASGYDAFMVATTATRLNPNPGEAGYADAAYIAMMHPGLGEALADWLDYEANWADPPTHRAIAVARLINGSAS